MRYPCVVVMIWIGGRVSTVVLVVDTPPVATYSHSYSPQRNVVVLTVTVVVIRSSSAETEVVTYKMPPVRSKR